jgi:hypothetical protein
MVLLATMPGHGKHQCLRITTAKATEIAAAWSTIVSSA